MKYGETNWAKAARTIKVPSGTDRTGHACQWDVLQRIFSILTISGFN